MLAFFENHQNCSIMLWENSLQNGNFSIFGLFPNSKNYVLTDLKQKLKEKNYLALRGWCSVCQTVSSEFFALLPKNQILTYTCIVHVFERSITQSTGLDDWRCLVTSYIEVKFQFKPEPHTSTCTLLLQQSPGICNVVHLLWYR